MLFSLIFNCFNAFTASDNLSQVELLHKIIEENISASYSADVLPHDMINSIYTHSTSPLRRASDCIVHFLLKSRFLNIEIPFTNEQLHLWADHLTVRAKYLKNQQFKDIKLRTFQWISEEFISRLNPIKIKVKIMGYKKPFLNLMIISIDDMNVNIPYTLKRFNINININNNIIDVSISKINISNKYDEGTLPELDSII